jgi:hypothetical protein
MQTDWAPGRVRQGGESDRDRFWCLRVDLEGQRCEGNGDFHCWSLVVYDYVQVAFLLFL